MKCGHCKNDGVDRAHVMAWAGVGPVAAPVAGAVATVTKAFNVTEFSCDKCGADHDSLADLFGHECEALIASRLQAKNAAFGTRLGTVASGQYDVVANGFGGTTTVKAAAGPTNPNRYAGTCHKCGAKVAEKAGELVRVAGKYAVECVVCPVAAPAPVAPVPAPAASAPVVDFGEACDLVEELIVTKFDERKFEVADVTVELRAFATEWAKRYDGDFAFLVEMAKVAAVGSLSPGQAKGTLNCFRADVMRKDPGAPTKEEVPDSRYAIENADGTVTFYQVTTFQGRRLLKRLVGAPGDFVKYPVQAAEAKKVWAILKAGPAHAAKLFSRKHTICARCAAPLSVLQSRATGFGETCANSMGVPYVHDEDEAKRILKEEGISFEGLILEAEAGL